MRLTMHLLGACCKPRHHMRLMRPAQRFSSPMQAEGTGNPVYDGGNHPVACLVQLCSVLPVCMGGTAMRIAHTYTLYRVDVFALQAPAGCHTYNTVQRHTIIICCFKTGSPSSSKNACPICQTRMHYSY